jgi:hypothetical protein
MLDSSDVLLIPRGLEKKKKKKNRCEILSSLSSVVMSRGLLDIITYTFL